MLGKYTDESSVTMALKEFGLQVNAKQLNEIVARIKDLSDKGKHVTDADLEVIAETVLGIIYEPTVRLEELSVVTGTHITPTSSIKLNINGDVIVEAGVGNGPVDAAIKALLKGISGVANIKLEDYHADAITGGTDALVEVWVKLSKDGEIITARGARTDIIMASVETVLNGMNRLIQ
ncbi:MAG: alpha-isopropylmalate synthase regulatory domain-containing protein [Patescibacteria group bacterium]|nr:alpha-isopropylmalate synthase regulatory domain-containing protein [Patescibacteria group bacterium]